MTLQLPDDIIYILLPLNSLLLPFEFMRTSGFLCRSLPKYLGNPVHTISIIARLL